MTNKSCDVGVIGAGAMGLAAAYHALKAGHKVTVYEIDKVPGGMAAHFDFEGVSLERFYHFVCKSDQAMFELLTDIGLDKDIKWVPTSMGYFLNGRLYDWGDPVSLIKFPLLNFIEKFRYGLTMFLTTKKKSWANLENISAKDWIISSCGRNTYTLLWEKLFDLKFFGFANDISAAWIATRIKRVGTSRKSIMQEELGYIKGGSETLINALCTKISAMGGKIQLQHKVQKVLTKERAVVGLQTNFGEFSHDRVISTVPLPYVNAMVPDLPEEWKENFNSIKNIGCVCVVVKLKKPLTKHFWLNINDKNIEIPGLVEFSNLRDFRGCHIVYLPYYMPQNHAKFSWSDEQFSDEVKKYLRKINPTICEDDITAIKIGRLKYAQPICEAGFQKKIWPVQTPIKGLQIADTCYYYPEDRGIAESVKLGKQMAVFIT